MHLQPAFVTASVILLHGPPGTGKTSLCKALAHKLTIRQDTRFRGGELIEINSHSLFSKWFSESGKLVMKMFEQIEAVASQEDMLVFVLIDEVESLTASRSQTMARGIVYCATHAEAPRSVCLGPQRCILCAKKLQRRS